MLSLDSMLGIYQRALAIREEKIDLISSNLVNQDTPEYKARDVDFKAVMAQQADFSNTLSLKPNNTVTISANQNNSDFPIQYRQAVSPSVDGNTVDSNFEKTAFMNNVVQYKSTLAFVRNHEAALLTAIRGE